MTERRSPSGPVERARLAPEREPLGAELDDGFREEQVARLWRGVQQRSVRRPRSIVRRSALVAAVVAAAAVVLWWLRPAPGPLELASGSAPTVLVGGGAAPLALSDGSRLELGRESRLEVLRNDSRSFVTVLRRGESTFDVKPGGPRRWVIETGIASVEVIGTRFRVRREADSVLIQVERGSVLVRAESVPNGVRRLGAGESLRVHSAVAAPAASSASSASSATPALSAMAAPPLPSAASTPAEAKAPSAPSMPRPSAGADAIETHLAAADAARERGDSATAIRHLEEVVRLGAKDDPRRGMAALTLARLTVDADPSRAARALDDSMQSMPDALAEDALARRVEAEARAGRRERAAELAAEYLRRFPNGHRVRDVERWREP